MRLAKNEVVRYQDHWYTIDEVQEELILTNYIEGRREVTLTVQLSIPLKKKED